MKEKLFEEVPYFSFDKPIKVFIFWWPGRSKNAFISEKFHYKTIEPKFGHVFIELHLPVWVQFCIDIFFLLLLLLLLFCAFKSPTLRSSFYFITLYLLSTLDTMKHCSIYSCLHKHMWIMTWKISRSHTQEIIEICSQLCKKGSHFFHTKINWKSSSNTFLIGKPVFFWSL